MTVLILERVPGKLRGEITRWMLEISDGVFVNRLSGTVRDYLWELVIRSAKPRTAAMLVYASSSDQGFSIRFHGKPSHAVIDFDGLTLIRTAP